MRVRVWMRPWKHSQGGNQCLQHRILRNTDDPNAPDALLMPLAYAQPLSFLSFYWFWLRRAVGSPQIASQEFFFSQLETTWVPGLLVYVYLSAVHNVLYILDLGSSPSSSLHRVAPSPQLSFRSRLGDNAQGGLGAQQRLQTPFIQSARFALHPQ